MREIQMIFPALRSHLGPSPISALWRPPALSVLPVRSVYSLTADRRMAPKAVTAFPPARIRGCHPYAVTGPATLKVPPFAIQ